MLQYLCHGHAYTMEEYLRTVGKVFQDKIHIDHYARFVKRPQIRACSSYIFSDLERVKSADLPRVHQIWQKLDSLERAPKLLNHPLKVLKRVPLLQALYAQGLNEFNVYPLVQGILPTPERFPVFIRMANDHRGPRTRLLETPEELRQCLEHMQTHFEAWEQEPIITEFIDVADQNGIYKKYGAFKIGERIVPTHILLEKQWLVKNGDLEPSPYYVDEELDYVQTHPHQRELQEIFALAQIDYGRIDYGFYRGRLQVFEINTNPMLLGDGSDDFDCRLPRRKTVVAAVQEAFSELL